MLLNNEATLRRAMELLNVVNSKTSLKNEKKKFTKMPIFWIWFSAKYSLFVRYYTRTQLLLKITRVPIFFVTYIPCFFFSSSIVFFFILHHFRIAAFSYFIIFFLFFNFSVGTTILHCRRPSFKFQLPLLYSSASATASITIAATATSFDDQIPPPPSSLYGDPSHGQDKFVQVKDGFACALDVVKFCWFLGFDFVSLIWVLVLFVND